MKKLSFLLLLALICTCLFGCNNANNTNVNVDKDLVGAWQLSDESKPEYYIFTEDSKVKIVRGTVSFEGEAVFTADKQGNHTYLSNFYYLSGELAYSFNGDTVTFDDGAGNVMTMNKVDYTEPELKKYDDFNSDNLLTGTWYNEEYNDVYEFNSDGTAKYSMEIAELEYISSIDYTYTVKDSSIYFTYDDGTGSQEMVSTYEISGDTLIIDGSAQYTRQ